MNKSRYFDAAFDALLKEALIQNLDKEIEQLVLEERENPTSFSIRHQKRMGRLLAVNRRRDRFRPMFEWGKKVAVTASLIIALLASSLMLVPEVRAAVVDTIVVWYEQFTQFIFKPNEEADTKTWEIAGLPEEYTAQVVSDNSELSGVDYINHQSGQLIIFQYAKDGSALSVDNEEIAYEAVEVEGITYSIFVPYKQDDFCVILWGASGYRFSVTAQGNREQLLALAKQVKIKR